MSSNKKVIARAACGCAILATVMMYCTSLNMAGTSEVGNPEKVSAVIVDSAGRAVCGVPVSLVPENNNLLRGSIGFQKQKHGYAGAQMSFPSDTSDEYGKVDVGLADTGIYNLIATSTAYQYKLFVSSIIVGKDAAVNLDTVHLREPGTMVVNIDSALYTAGGMLVMPGTLLAAAVDHPGTIAMIVPAGDISIRYITGTGDTIPGAPSLQDIVVGEGQTVFAAINGTSSVWKYSMQVHLNTTAAGANVAGNVINFPVLVRLNSGNFNFADAKSGGDDIRFTKSDGTPLPYEIERWDTSQGSAELWVKVDTVFGNDSSHFIAMYWGASTGSTTVSLSNGAAVFDTLNGFQGVWHMGQSATAVAFDATANRFNGVPSSPSPVQTPGVVGMCQEFNGNSNFIQMPGTASGKLNFPENGSYSIAAWVYIDTLDFSIAKIIEKHDLQYKLQKDPLNRWEFSEFESVNEYSISTSAAAASEKVWVYLTGVRSGGSQYLYVNGVCVTSAIKIQVSPYSRDTGHDITVGRAAATDFSPLYFFKGKIDETRIENRARSADWIKLCFMNQNAEDRLVVFK
jgi:hypothetical protein